MTETLEDRVADSSPGGSSTIRLWAPRTITGPLVVGLVLRYVLAPFTSWPGDVVVWYQTAVGGQQHLKLYERSQFSFPPVWGYLLHTLGRVLGAFGQSPSHLASAVPTLEALNRATNSYASVVTSPGFNVAFKTVLFAFDLATGWVLFRLVELMTGDRRLGRAAFAIWFLNPLVLFESAVFGSFDVLVAFFIVGSCYLLMTRRYALSGALLAIGVLTKVTPVFLLPILTVTAANASVSQRRIDVDRRSLGRFVAGGLAATAVLLLPIAVGHELPGALHDTFSRTGTLSIGGFSIFGLVTIRGTEWLNSFSQAHSSIVVTLGTLIALGTSLLVAGRLMRLSQREKDRVLLPGCLAVMIALFATQPLTQPQYLIWALPLVVCLVCVSGQRVGALLTLSTAPVVYVYGLLGPYALLAPAARYTSLLSVDTVAGQTYAWFTKPTHLWGVTFGANYRSLAVIAGLAAMVVLARSCWDQLRITPSPDQGVTGDGAWSARVLPHQALVIPTALVVLAAAAYLGATAVAPGAGSLRVVSAGTDSAGVRLHLVVHAAPGQASSRLAAIPLSTVSSDRAVDVLVDPEYPGPDSDQVAVRGVYDHLVAELRTRGDRRAVREIDARQEVEVLKDLAGARSTAVVMTAGVMPAVVYSQKSDLLTPWIKAGGMLVWSGDAIGYYSEGPVPGFVADNADSLFASGPPRLVGSGVVIPGKQPGRVATSPTQVGRALAIQASETSVSVDAQRVLSIGGRLLGYVGDGVSSLSEIPVGQGRVLIFAGDTYDEQIIAHDLCVILMSHADENVAPVSTLDLARASGSVDWTVPPLASGELLRLVVMDPSADGIAYRELVVTPSR